MSFWDVLKKVGRAVAGIEHTVAPIVEMALPQFAPEIAMLDGWVNRVHSAVITVEHNLPGDGQGGIKQNAVIADFEAGIDITNAVLAQRGKMLQYDNGALQTAINSFVAAYNALATVKQSFKEVDLPK